MRECTIHALCASDSVVIIDRGMSKKKRIELKTELCLCSVNPSPYNTLIPAQYTSISVVIDGAHDNRALTILLLHDSVVSYRFTHSIIE